MRCGRRAALILAYAGRLIVAGRYDQSRAGAIVGGGLADLVVFGRTFIANPDLPARFRHGWPLAAFDGGLFGGDAHGYTSYPAYASAA